MSGMSKSLPEKQNFTNERKTHSTTKSQKALKDINKNVNSKMKYVMIKKMTTQAHMP